MTGNFDPCTNSKVLDREVTALSLSEGSCFTKIKAFCVA